MSHETSKQVELSYLEKSRFKFYLDDSFRKSVFLALRKKYGTWDKVCKELHVCMRALFGLRRGYNYENGRKVLRFLRACTLAEMCRLLGLELNHVQDKIRMIEIGNRRENVRFPISLTLNENIYDLKRSVIEFLYSSDYEKTIPTKNPFRKQGSYTMLDIGQFKRDIIDRIKTMNLQGLRPSISQESMVLKVSYRVPGTNRRTTITIPKKIVFDERFAKEFGKWMGDRAGGPHKVGVSNTEFNFIRDFKCFLRDYLFQPNNQIKVSLSCKPGFIPSEELKEHADAIETCKTQYGDFGFSVIVSNKLLRNLIFDRLEKYWFEILYNSIKNVRMAFYSGLFEAEGSVDGSTISWAFGLNLKGDVDYASVISLLEKATKLKFLLHCDGFDSILSRKLSIKSRTLKYDVRIFRNSKQRELELNLFKDIIKYVNHPNKLSQSKNLIYLIENGGKTKMTEIDTRLIPEVNIGTLGH